MNLDGWRHYLRARFLELVRRPEAAMNQYRLALKHAPDFARAAHALAFLLVGRSRQAEAEPWFREVVRIKPRNALAWYNLGFLYDRQNEPAKAVTAFREAVRLKPKFDLAWYGLGLGLSKLGNHTDAVQALQQAATLEPMNAHVWYLLGMTHHVLHQADELKAVILHLHRFDPKMTRRLIHDAERPDLAHLVADLRV